MSFLEQVLLDGPDRYVLPRLGEMCCSVAAFLSESLFAGTNEGLWADAYRSACFPGAVGVYLLPDCHKGYVLPVGGVLVTENTIVQAGSAYDVSCGVVALRVPGLQAAGVADWDVRRRWVAAVEHRGTPTEAGTSCGSRSFASTPPGALWWCRRSKWLTCAGGSTAQIRHSCGWRERRVGTYDRRRHGPSS